MSPTPTGRLIGDDLVLTRTFRASIDDVWASLTDPARTAVNPSTLARVTRRVCPLATIWTEIDASCSGVLPNPKTTSGNPWRNSR